MVRKFRSRSRLGYVKHFHGCPQDVRSEELTKIPGVGQQRAAFVPESGPRLTQRSTPVHDANDAEAIAMGFAEAFKRLHAAFQLHP